MEIEDIEELLAEYKSYRNSGGESITGFGEWIVGQNKKKEQLRDTEGDFVKEIDRTFKNRRVDERQMAELSMFWGRLDRYKHMLFKASLKDTPINNIDEFALLIYVQMNGEPNMRDFVRDSLLEPTTCFEMIKRLKRNGLVKDKPDPNDKRSKLIYLTDKGQTATELTKGQLTKVNHILYKDATESDKEHLHRMFTKLVGFHAQLHMENPDANFEDLVAAIED